MADKRRRSADRRRARLEAERRRRQRKGRRLGIGVGVAVVALVVVLVVVLTGSNGSSLQYLSPSGVDPNALPGILKTPQPWPINTKDVAARLVAERVPPLGATEGQALHIHQHIDIYIRGQHITVPAHIGIVISSAQVLYAPIHTHDATGIIHVESTVRRDFSLGEFFDVWGVYLTQGCIGSYCGAGTERLQVFANGKVVTGDPRRLKLLEHEEIVVTFGTPDQIPKPYPVSYPFPSSLYPD